ncbi:hypothetical protein M8C21_024898, partial [Ambrosia artemisiifolia]
PTRPPPASFLYRNHYKRESSQNIQNNLQLHKAKQSKAKNKQTNSVFNRGFLLHMLPKKRLVEVVNSDADTATDNTTTTTNNNSESLRKKARIGCLTASCTSISSRATSDSDGKKKRRSSGGEESSVSASSTVVEPSVTNMGLDDGSVQDIDEDLHSRQLAVYGRETMRRLFAANVLVSGMQGLGAEIGCLDLCFESEADNKSMLEC